MKIKKIQDDSIIEDYVAIHYRKMNQEISDIIQYLKSKTMLLGKEGEETKILNPNDIFYIEVVDRKSFAYLKDEVLRIDEGLKDISEGSLSNRFIRINKSMLVNVYKIDKMIAESNMRIKLTLENGEHVIVNRAYKKEFFSFFNKLDKEII